MSFTTSVDPDYMGPTLRELLPIIGDLPQPIEVRWLGTAEDNRLYNRYKHLTFSLITPSCEVAEKAMWAHGGKPDLPPEDVEAARKALTTRSSNSWRTTAEGLGAARSTLLLTKVVGDAIRSGKKPGISTIATIDCLFNKVNPADVDILIRLRSSQG